MLRLVQFSKTIALVSYDAPEKTHPEISDWNVKRSTFTTYREAWIGVPNGWTEKTLNSFLTRNSRGSIYRTVANNPILGLGDTNLDFVVKTQQVVINGRPYIDMFGLHVYIASRAAWDIRSDVDLRFPSHQYPYHHLDPEIEMILNADYDLLNREGPDKPGL